METKIQCCDCEASLIDLCRTYAQRHGPAGALVSCRARERLGGNGIDHARIRWIVSIVSLTVFDLLHASPLHALSDPILTWKKTKNRPE